ncbi:MAG: hypothetical protein ACRDNS_30355, partial [Trebonia sp.]
MSLRDRFRAFLAPDLTKAAGIDLRGQVQGMQGYAPTSSAEGGGQNVMFGPSQAPRPLPIGGDPRQFQYRPGWNLPTLPGEGRVSYQTLRDIADSDWALRKAIEVRKDEICRLSFDLVARDRDGRRARQTLKARADKVAEIKTALAKPDGRRSWQSWLRAILEDHFVLDSACVVKGRDHDPDGGPIGPGGDRLGRLVALDYVDGATIKVLLDDSGRLPLPPLPAYQQYIYGYPRESFTTQELLYLPQDVRSNKVYGFSRVEQFLYLISVHLRFWTSQGARYTDGTLPEGVVIAPENWTLQQIQDMSTWWDGVLAGDPKALRKLQFVPHGVAFQQFKSDTFDETLARFLLDAMCVSMDVTPIELGLEPSHGGLGGKGLGETVERVQERRSLRPTLRWLFDDFLNPLIAEEYDAPDLEWTALELDEQSETDRATALNTNIRNGLIPLDEAIEEMGGEPIGIGRIFALGPTIVLGEPDLLQLTREGAATLGLLPGATPPAPVASTEPQETSPHPGSAAVLGPAQDARDKEIAQIDAQKAVEVDLRKWRTTALNAAQTRKPGRTLGVPFESSG